MKKQSINIIRKGIYTSFITASFLLSTVGYSYANGTDDPKKKADVKYEGKADKYLAFNINYRNPNQKRFSVELLDKDTREVLYHNEYRDSSFSRKFYLLVQTPDCVVTFRIKNGRELLEQSFNISNEIRVEDNLSVTKL